MSDPFKLKSTVPQSHNTQEVQPTSIDFLPHDIIQAIKDSGDWQRRTSTLENLKSILEEVSDISALLSNFSAFVSFLVSLLDDSHFRVIHTTLQIIEMLAERFGDKIEIDILDTTDSILHRITENRNSLYAREKMPKFFLKLMRFLNPHTLMMRLVTSSLHSRSHKIREDTLILIIAGLLTFPRTEFDLGSIAEHVVPLIADSRQRVRFMALETIAVVAHALEPGLLQETRSNYMQPLLSPVQRWEAENMSQGILLKVIQARLSRKKLPYITSDETVEPAVPFPTNASRQDNGMDLEWIISSTIERTQGEENEVSTNGSKLLPLQPPRRFSAGRQKLPWEKERKEQSLSAPTKKEDGSYQMNFLNKQHEKQPKAPPPTYSNWLADPNTAKNLSRSDRFYSANNSPKQPRLSYMDQYMGSRMKYSDPMKREEFVYGEREESEFQNEFVYPTEPDLSQSWPAQFFENSQPLHNAETGHLNPNNTTTSQFPFKLAKARPCSKQQPNNPKPDRRPVESTLPPGKASLHLPAIERETVDKSNETSQSEIERPIKLAKKRERRAYSSKPKMDVTPISSELSQVASSCSLGPSKKEGITKETMYSFDAGNLGKNNYTLPRYKRLLGSEKILVKTKPRSNTLPNPPPVSSKSIQDNNDDNNNNDNNNNNNEKLKDRLDDHKNKIKEQPVFTREEASSSPTQTWTNDLTATGQLPEQLRGNQVADPFEEEAKLIVKPPKAKPVRVSSKTRLRRRTFIGPIPDITNSNLDTSLASSIAVDVSTTSLQDSTSNLLPKQREKSNSLPRLPSDTAGSYSPEPQEIIDKCEDNDTTPTPGDPTTCNSNNVTPVVSNKPSPDSDENITEEICYNNHGLNSSLIHDSDQKQDGEKVQHDFSQKQHNPSIKPPIPVRPQQKESSSYFGIYHKKKTFETEPSSTNSSTCNLSKRIEVDSILPNKIESKKRQSYENVSLTNNESNSGRPVRRRVDLTRNLNHSVDDDLEDLSLFNDTSESVFSLSPSFGRFRASAESGSMDTSALSQLSLSPQELKKTQSPVSIMPVKNKTSSVHNSPYEMIGTSPMDCSPIDKLARSPSYSPSHPTGGVGANRVYTKGFSPSKAVKQAPKKSPTHNKATPPIDLAIGKKGNISVVGISPTAIYTSPKHSILPASPARSKYSPLKDIKPSLDSVQIEDESVNPVSHPGESLIDALCFLEDESWECKIEGLVLIKRLCRHHTDTLFVQIKQVVLAVIAEVKNLRSSVSKVAIITFCDLFVYINKMLEPFLELIIKALLHKAGESNMFIRDDVEKSLYVMIQNISANKAFTALISGGIGHKNPVVRKLAMQVICYGVDQIGDVQVLNLPRDVIEKLMVSITNTSQDNSPDARYYARKAITLLFDNPDFVKKISKNLNPDLVTKVLDLFKLVQTKGVGELPNAGLQSARQSRVGQAPTRQNPHSADTRIDTTGSVKTSYALRQGTKTTNANCQKQRINSQTQNQEMSFNYWIVLIVLLSLTICLCDNEESMSNERLLHLVEALSDISFLGKFFAEIGNVSEKCKAELNTFSFTSKDPSTSYLYLLDSFSKPPTGLFQGNFKWLGDWHECKQLNNTEYVKIVIPVPILLKDSGLSFVGVSLAPDIAICLPAGCSNRNDTLNIINNFIVLIQPDVPINITAFVNTSTFKVYPEEKDPDIEITRFISFGIIILFILMATVATIVQVVTYYCNKCIGRRKVSKYSPPHEIVPNFRSNSSYYPSEDEINIQAIDSSLEPLEENELSEHSRIITVLTNILKSFSLYSNIQLLFSGPSNPQHSIDCLTGIRSLSMLWILLCRSYLWYLFSGAISDVENMLYNAIPRISFTVVWNGLSAMESLFIISGCLAMFLSLKELNSPDKPSLLKYFVKCYLYHFLRVTPTYLILLFLMWKITPLLGSGPMWNPTVDKLIGSCDKNWWPDVLYIQTFYPSAYIDTCLSWSFYVAIEIQFLLFSPLFILPAHYLRLPYSLILPVFCFIVFTCAPIPLLITRNVNSHISYLVNNYLGLYNISDIIDHAHSLEEVLVNEYYNKLYYHYVMYLGGLIVGYVLFELPAWRSNSKSDIKFDRKLGLFCITVFPIVSLLIIVLTFAPTWLFHGMPIVPELTYTLLVVIKPLWAVCIALLILCLALGFGGPFNALFSWKVWAPLSRLTFVVYLTHPIIMTLFFLTLRRTIPYNPLTFSFIIAGLMILNVTILPEDIHARLDSKKWFERLEAIKEIHELMTQHSSNISHDQRVVKVIETYILRLTDSNSKVNLMAIECFLDVITVLGNKLVQHLHPIFKALTSNLASKNTTIKTKAKESLENILKSIDHTYLVQPLSSVAQYANNLVRPVLLNTLADVSDTLFDKKPGVVQKYVLPLIFSLLEHHLNAECSAALQNLCKVVYQYMNKSLFEKASRLSTSQQDKLRKLAS
ncbi:Nose resistant to fluoxetine protein 6-like [Oopsacas minuta]|uniref:Nose resistant to fluoxetine protein 6-like n=1 Tax=Oopsacas minuta TaxID=111878 RepID=A0AAV7KBA7_9METZ|nr:Nose resistant to fluoxetine protein 6-like [Oopsacas minuta]